MTDYPPFTVAKPKPASGKPPDEETPPGADIAAPRRGRPRKNDLDPVAQAFLDIATALRGFNSETKLSILQAMAYLVE